MEARQQFTQRLIGEKLSVTAKTISRWENRQTQISLFVEPALREILKIGSAKSSGPESFTFVDLFAGIGGIHLG
jgi:DNA (cytosine-5)-methyltransferase 1